jgi:RNA:NAD 2'-phosphotransferase (TPT1/KptA family)
MLPYSGLYFQGILQLKSDCGKNNAVGPAIILRVAACACSARNYDVTKRIFVYLCQQAKEAFFNHIQFYKEENAVWLSDPIPSKYIVNLWS